MFTVSSRTHKKLTDGGGGADDFGADLLNFLNINVVDTDVSACIIASKEEENGRNES